MKLNVMVLHCETRYLTHLTDYLEGNGLGVITKRPADELDENYDAVIYAGGIIPVEEYSTIKSWSIKFIRNLKKPFLGICLGHQMLGIAYGASFRHMKTEGGKVMEEKGLVEIKFEREFPFAPGRKTMTVYEDHERELFRLRGSLINYASSQISKIQAISHEVKSQYGVQFHPELGKDNDGHVVLDEFIKSILIT
jgi:GMP synthase-like glutamine amidotransferase